MRSVCLARRQKGFENLLNQMHTVPPLLFSLFNEPITFVIVAKKLNNSFVSVTQIGEIGK